MLTLILKSIEAAFYQVGSELPFIYHIKRKKGIRIALAVTLYQLLFIARFIAQLIYCTKFDNHSRAIRHKKGIKITIGVTRYSPDNLLLKVWQTSPGPSETTVHFFSAFIYYIRHKKCIKIALPVTLYGPANLLLKVWKPLNNYNRLGICTVYLILNRPKTVHFISC